MKKNIKRKLKQTKKPKRTGVNVNIKIDLRKQGRQRKSITTTQPKAQSISYIPWTATQYNPNILSDIREGVKSDLANVQKQAQQSQKELLDYINKSLPPRDGKLDDKNQTSSFLLTNAPEVSEFEKEYGIKEDLLKNPQWQQKAMTFLGINKPKKVIDIKEPPPMTPIKSMDKYPPISPISPSKAISRKLPLLPDLYPPISPSAPSIIDDVPSLPKKKPSIDKFKGIKGYGELKKQYKIKFGNPAPKKSTSQELYNKLFD